MPQKNIINAITGISCEDDEPSNAKEKMAIIDGYEGSFACCPRRKEEACGETLNGKALIDRCCNGLYVLLHDRYGCEEHHTGNGDEIGKEWSVAHRDAVT